jgi:hypothetical protein
VCERRPTRMIAAIRPRRRGADDDWRIPRGSVVQTNEFARSVYGLSSAAQLRCESYMAARDGPGVSR